MIGQCKAILLAPLTSYYHRLTDALLNDILNEVADEVEGIFVDIADKFIDKI